ncbi:unnamed protein product, partial [Brenthis ino]
MWRYCLVLTVLLLLPLEIGSKLEDDEQEDGRAEEEDNEEENDDEEDEEENAPSKVESIGRRALLMQTTLDPPVTRTRTTKKRLLECYVCAHKPDSMLRACLDPTKYRVHTMTCHSVDDKCFTSVISKGSLLEAVVRGCRSGCIGSPDITCCDLNRCNNQAFTMPSMVEPRALMQSSKAIRTFPSSVLFFVTILLVLQTVVKVTFV